MKKNQNKSIKLSSLHYGSILFGVGILISLIAGFLSLGPSATKVVIGTLIILGIIVGILNIKNEEVVEFLVASFTLVILLGPFLGLVSQNFIQAEAISKIFGYIVAFIVPAAIIVALKAIFLVAKDE